MATGIIIGASYGIGREIAVQLSARRDKVGVAARNYLRLRELVGFLGTDNCVAREMDISHPGQVREGVSQLRTPPMVVRGPVLKGNA